MNSDRWTESRHLREQERSDAHGAIWLTPWKRRNYGNLYLALTMFAIAAFVAAWAIGGN